MPWESNEGPRADSQHVRWNNDLNSSAAVVLHISPILRIAERLNKKGEINTQIGYRNEMSAISTCKTFIIWTTHFFFKSSASAKEFKCAKSCTEYKSEKARQITLNFKLNSGRKNTQPVPGTQPLIIKAAPEAVPSLLPMINLLLYCTSSNQAIYSDRFLLANSPGSFTRLCVRAGVPVRVINDNPVCAH